MKIIGKTNVGVVAELSTEEILNVFGFTKDGRHHSASSVPDGRYQQGYGVDLTELSVGDTVDLSFYYNFKRNLTDLCKTTVENITAYKNCSEHIIAFCNLLMQQKEEKK